MKKHENKTVRSFAPATIANFVCGYDILGFALNDLGDEVELTSNDSSEITFELKNSDNELASIPTGKNVAHAMVKLFKDKMNLSQGVHICLHKNMPLNSGLGSSSASAVAALVAVNALFDSPLSIHDLLPLAMEGERLACGVAHADNVAPALFGGIVLVRSHAPLDAIQIPSPEKLVAAVIHPQVHVPTRDARKIMNEYVLLKDAVLQWGNVAGLVTGLHSNNYDLIGRSMQDFIIEPTRSLLIPCFYEMKALALKEGALGFGISGSGPSVFALCDNIEVAKNITNKINSLLLSHQVESDYFVSKINLTGAQVKN